METDWILLAASIVILWLPATLLYPASGKDWLAQSHSARFKVERMLATWQHWFDFVRALGGTFFLTIAAESITAGDAGGDHLGFIFVGGILAIAVAFQTIQYRNGYYFTAPVFFLWGMTFILVEWPLATFAILFSVILARLANHVELKLPLMAGLLGVAGYMMDGLSLNLIMTAGLVVLPVVIAFASMHHLVCYSRDLAFK